MVPPLCSSRVGQSIQKFEDVVQEHTEKVLLSHPGSAYSNTEVAKGKCCEPQVVVRGHEVALPGRAHQVAGDMQLHCASSRL